MAIDPRDVMAPPRTQAMMSGNQDPNYQHAAIPVPDVGETLFYTPASQDYPGLPNLITNDFGPIPPECGENSRIERGV